MGSPMLDRMDAAALIALVRHGIETDVQDLIVQGDPRRGIPPYALRAAIRAVLQALLQPSEEMLADGRDVMLPYVNLLAKPVPDQWFLAGETFTAMIRKAMGE